MNECVSLRVSLRQIEEKVTVNESESENESESARAQPYCLAE